MASTSVILTREGTAGPSATYSYCNRPRALPGRQKYRSSIDANETEEEAYHYANLMYERRVVRGNTYALHILPWSSEPDPLELQRQREAQRKALARRRARDQLRTRTPEPLEGRRHVDVQTELYLEELADRIIEVDMECQTDAFLDRPATPLFIPAKTGRDVATQIWEGDLFDFDIEVRPMLEVLVGKTIEQALLEVMEEEELADLRAHQYAYHELRCAELAEVQRLEEQERRHREEKERRKKQQLEFLQREKETSEKIAARAFAQRYLSDLIPSVFGSLRDSGYFYDPVERDIETGFFPGMLSEVEEIMENRVLGRTIADNLIRDTVEMRLDCYEKKVLPVRPEVVLPPAPEYVMIPSKELLFGSTPVPQEVMEQLEALGQLEPLDQLDVSSQLEALEKLEAPDQPEASEQPPISDQPEVPAPDQPESAPDQEKTAEEPESKEPQ
ncbi:radial spoke head protein 3 homolog B-like [Zootoca vivipara]|uniref:radial spoke head protein 3 homolog B-like n=1 Tax=Zootoca vivipara TaxID=8524 RepID=UPI001592AE6C|nr:radial spoke head protein 3 homolog B-like [Zootoca vivipara]